MTIRLHVVATLALMAAWPLADALAGADPLKLPGTAPKPASDAKPAAMLVKPASAEGAAPAAAGAAPLSEAQKYCQNIAAAAADARFAWQSKKLADAEAQIKQRLADLETRQAEFKDVLTRYNDAVKRAKAGLIDIYAKMKAETAAAQIAAMDDGPAAAILSQLNPQKASAILNEIPPDRAVRLVTTMSSLAPPPDKKS